MEIIGYRAKYSKKGSLKRLLSTLFSSTPLKTHLKETLNKDHNDNVIKGPYQNSYFHTALFSISLNSVFSLISYFF